MKRSSLMTFVLMRAPSHHGEIEALLLMHQKSTVGMTQRTKRREVLRRRKRATEFTRALFTSFRVCPLMQISWQQKIAIGRHRPPSKNQPTFAAKENNNDNLLLQGLSLVR
jgi:hypothetical protein